MQLNTRKINRSSLRGELFAFVLVFTACGQEAPDENKSEPNQQSQTVVIQSQPKPKNFARIPVSFSSISAGFSLGTPVSAYTIDLTSCLSGYSATVTEANTDGLEVYRYDRSCLAKLSQFTFGGKTYFPTAGDPFTTWQVGDDAIFDEAGEPGTDPLSVTVLATIGNPVTGSEVITYGIRYLDQGASRSILGATIGTSGKLKFGANTEPSFTMYQVELKGISGSEAGQFQFIMECNSDIGITNICETVDFTDIDYLLLEDTYSSAPTIGEMDTAFGGGGETSITLPDDRIAPGSNGTTNGGIFTVTLDGPDTLDTKPNMLLVLRSYGVSYQYFNIDINISESY